MRGTASTTTWSNATSRDATPCLTLGLHWVVAPVVAAPPNAQPVALRLADDAGKLVMSEEETVTAELAAEATAHRTAEARVRELEAELRRRSR